MLTEPASSTTTPSQTNRQKWWTPIRSLRVLHCECSVQPLCPAPGTWDFRQPTKGEHMAEQVRADGVGVVGGVDTHRDFHVGAVVDDAGRLLGSDQFRALTPPPMRSWSPRWGRGVGSAGSGWGGTGSYGAGLTRHLTDAGYRCGGSEPSQPSAAPPAGQDRLHRR